MPRPRRTKVASNEARVVTSSSESAAAAPRSHASKQSKTNSMAPLKRSARGGASKFKTNMETEEIESSGQQQKAKKAPQPKPKAKATRRPAKKKKSSTLLDKMVNDDDDVEDDEAEVRTSALDMLKARGVGVGRTSSTSRRTSAESNAENMPPSSAQRAQSRIASTPQVRPSSVVRGRGRTPSVQPNTDDDLYGLSPAGKASQARFAAPRRSSVPRAPLSALKVHGTPGMETSVLALQNFKRRARQPSLIRMVQQSSELGREDEEALLGVESEFDDTLGDFDNLIPQDESTPLNFGKKKQDPEEDAAEPRTTSSRKRKRGQDEEEVEVPRSPYCSSPPHIEGTTWARSERSSSLPEERIVASAEELDPINAEPLSQSDILVAPRSSSAQASPKRRKADNAAKTRNANTKSKKAPKMSTAQLQSLLPMPKSRSRQARAKATYEIPSDSEEEEDTTRDDDELSRPNRRRATTTTRKAKTPLAKKDTNKRAAKKASPAKAKSKRTYGRQQSVEKENDNSAFARSLMDEDEDTIEVATKTTGKNKLGRSKELEKARKMFAKVDEWEMEFESVDLGGGESSPWR